MNELIDIIEDMKLIRLIVEEVTVDVPLYRKIKDTGRIQQAIITSLDELPTTMIEPEIEDFQREIYAYGWSYKEMFYIRKEDKEALLELLKGFTNQAKKDLLVKIYQHVIELKNPSLLDYVAELIKECDLNK